MHDNVEIDNRVNFDIIQRYIKKFKPHKDDGNYGFKSDHLINTVIPNIFINAELYNIF